VGALRVHPHEHYANYPPQEDRGFAGDARVDVDCQSISRDWEHSVPAEAQEITSVAVIAEQT
jgi:hypothetical protein